MIRRSDLVIVTALGATGCYTTTNVAKLSPLDTAYPVSASSQYVTSAGEVVDETGYTLAGPFEFEKTVKGPRHETTETPLVVTDELNRLLAASSGDAIVNLKLQAVRYDTGSHGSAASWKMFGWSFGLTGATFLVFGAAGEGDFRDSALTLGGVFAGVGALGFLLGAASTEPASWHFKVTGQVVKSKAPAPEVPSTPPGSAPASTQPAPPAPPSVAAPPPASSAPQPSAPPSSPPASAPPASAPPSQASF